MKPYSKRLLTAFALLGFAGALPSQAVEIPIGDYSLVPNGMNETTTFQHTDVSTPNGGVVLPTTNGTVVYVISTFTFGTGSEAHLQGQFSTSATVANRLGVEIQDTGLVQFLGSGDSTRTNFNFNQDMAGQTVTLIAKLSFDLNNNVTAGKADAGSDTIMNVWVNPTSSDVEGLPNSLAAGDMSTIWNSSGFSYFRQTIQNQLTPETAGASSITNTKVLTGANATFSNALLAAGITPPSTVVNAGTSTVSASPLVVPANAISTSTVTVTLKNADSIPIAGKLVSLSGNPGNATIQPAGAGTDTTNGGGQATFTVKSGTAGTVVFSATGDSVPITQTASVAFELPLTDAGNSMVMASPATVPADGAAESLITVTLKSSSGQSLPGKLVSLAKTAGPGTPSINPVATGADTTNANGVATFTISSATAGTMEFTATCDTDTVTLTGDAVSVNFVTPDAPALLVYEGFDYPLGVLTGNNGGTGFSAGWTAPEAAFVCQVYDQSGGTLATWDNVVSGVTMSSPPRYIASVNTANPGSTAARVLSSAAGTLAGADNVLWMGVVFHYEDTNGSAGLNIGLSSGGSVVDRGRKLNTAGMDFIGVTNWNQASGSWNNRVNATIVDDNIVALGYTGPYAQTVGTQALSTTEDLLVVMKFTFGASDRVEAAFFKESDSLSEAAFYSNPSYVSATYLAGIDESALNTISYTQQRGFNALDEIRLGSTFANTFGGGAVVPDFDTWAGNYPGLGAAGADDDGDGLTNDEERIFGLNPQNGASANPYATPFNRATGGFSYTRRTQSLTGLTYKVCYSTNLVDWFVDTGAGQTPGTPTNDIEIVPVQISASLLTQPKLFIRVSAEDLGPPPPPPVAPELSSLWGSGTTITLNFSEAMNATSATDMANYTVALDGGGSITVSGASLSGNGKTVTLALGSALGIDSAYNVAMSNLTGSGSGEPLGGGGTAQFLTWDNDPAGIKVFILAGQSNMVGYGKTEDGGNPAWTPTNGLPKEIPGGLGCLRYLAKNNASFPVYDFTSLLVDPGNLDSAWRTRSDVKVWWHNGHSGNLGDPVSKGDLGPPFKGGNAGWFGPEYAFGQVLGDHYTGANQDVLIIKTAWGGHSLGGNFRPPSAVADRGGVVGASYREMVANVREVLSSLGTEFPVWSGRGYQIVGFGWHQGVSDGSEPFATEYKDNLPDLISDVRAEFGKPNLPFVIASTGMQGVNGTKPPQAYPYPDYTKVEKAQLWVAGVTQPANVLSDDTRSYWREANVSPSTVSYHWNHSAESYFLVGKKMGDNMVDLLTP